MPERPSITRRSPLESRGWADVCEEVRAEQRTAIYATPMMHPTMSTIRDAEVPADIPALRALLLDYEEAIGFDLCFQDFDAELAGLPGAYVAPTGALLVAEIQREVVGCAALRPLDEGVAELK